MFCLAVLDDESACAEDLRTRIMHHPSASEFRVWTCQTVDDLAELCGEQHIDVLFADICLGGSDGIDGVNAVSRLNLQVHGTQIVYVTGMDGMYTRVRRAQMSAQFLQKPVRDEELFSVLDTALLAVGSWKPEILYLECRQGMSRIDPRDVMYIEAKGRKKVFFFEDGSLLEHEKNTMDELLSMLPYFFIKTHRSYIVNMYYARTLTAVGLMLRDGESEPLVARKYRKVVQEALVRF